VLGDKVVVLIPLFDGVDVGLLFIQVHIISPDETEITKTIYHSVHERRGGKDTNLLAFQSMDGRAEVANSPSDDTAVAFPLKALPACSLSFRTPGH